ncbi:MAG: cytochrome P450 [Myxococcota bacterium]|jgi:cytochrome P450
MSAVALLPELPRSPPMLDSSRPFGLLADFRADPLAVFMDAWQTCGDFAQVRVAWNHLLLLSSPRHARHVLITNAANYEKGTRGQVLLRKILGDGLLTAEGSVWRKHRRIANPAFRRKMIAGFAAAMAAATEELAEEIIGGEFDVADAMNRLTLRIAGRCFFGQDISEESSEIGSALSAVLDEFTRLVAAPFVGFEHIPTPRNLRYRRAVLALDAAAREIIAARREAMERGEDGGNDLLSMLLEARDPETGEGLSDQALRDEVLTMLLAGHETTANSLAWTLILLSRHPDVARKVEAEVDAVIGDGPVGFGEAMKLDWTGKVIKESMRLYPPAWVISRRAVEDDVIDGFPVPAGAFIFVSPYLIHRHPRYWENPEGFDPGRFDPERSVCPDGSPRPKDAYLPFGAGQRKCIGSHFAELEARIVLGVLMRRLRMSLLPGEVAQPAASITLRPEGGTRMVAVGR